MILFKFRFIYRQALFSVNFMKSLHLVGDKITHAFPGTNFSFDQLARVWYLNLVPILVVRRLCLEFLNYREGNDPVAISLYHLSPQIRPSVISSLSAILSQLLGQHSAFTPLANSSSYCLTQHQP